MKERIYYFDWSATSMIKPEEVKAAVLDAMENCASASRGGYGPGLEASRKEFEARERIAELFGIKNFHNVIFTKNITEALNIFLHGFINEGDHVISSLGEHNSVLRPLYHLREKGAYVDHLPLDEKGRVKIEELDRLKRPETKLVILAHASNVSGNVVDIKSVGEWCRENGIVFAIDAAQSAGELDINMVDDNVDVLCFTGHKSLLGPQGTGGIVFKKDLGVESIMRGGSGAKSFLKTMPEELPSRLEYGTSNIPGISGLNAAVKHLTEIGVNESYRKSMELARRFYKGVKDIEGIKFYGDYDELELSDDEFLKGEVMKRVPIVSLNVDDIPSQFVGDSLWRIGNVCVRPGSHCAPLIHTHFETVEQGIVRFSFSHQNTEEEVDHAVDTLKKVIEGFR